MPQTTLFSADDLSGWLHRTVEPVDAAVAERVVWGWLKPLLELTARPDAVSEELNAWAVELGGIAYTNPEGLSRYALENELTIYSSERRDEILRTVASGGLVAPGAAARPRGSFPRSPCYPDPAVNPYRFGL